MAKASDDAAPDFKAFKTMCAEIAAYRAKNAETAAEIDACLSAFSAPKEGAVPPQTVTAAAKAEIITELTAVFSTKLTEAIASAKTEGEKAAKAELVEFKKQMSALGIKGSELPAVPPAPPPVVPPTNGKDFLSMRAAVAAERKIKPAAAALVVIQEHPEIYREYQVKLGIIKAA